MVIVTARAPIPLKANDINLPRWFYNLSEEDYKKSSRNNLELQFSTDSKGKQLFSNVARVGRHLLKNYYLEIISKPNYLKMVSANSSLFLFHLIPISIKVSYELLIVSTSQNSADLTCTSKGEYPGWLEIISRLTFTKSFLQKHQQEETNYFAKDIVKKVQNKKL